MQIKRVKNFKAEDLRELFSSVEWDSAAYPEKLISAFQNSSHVISVWEDSTLIGIVRSMDDDCWSANIDCLVVHKKYQNQGLAKILMTELLKDLQNITYINVCPDEKQIKNFYESFGFKVIDGFYMQKINF